MLFLAALFSTLFPLLRCQDETVLIMDFALTVGDTLSIPLDLHLPKASAQHRTLLECTNLGHETYKEYMRVEFELDFLNYTNLRMTAVTVEGSMAIHLVLVKCEYTCSYPNLPPTINYLYANITMAVYSFWTLSPEVSLINNWGRRILVNPGELYSIGKNPAAPLPINLPELKIVAQQRETSAVVNFQVTTQVSQVRSAFLDSSSFGMSNIRAVHSYQGLIVVEYVDGGCSGDGEKYCQRLVILLGADGIGRVANSLDEEFFEDGDEYPAAISGFRIFSDKIKVVTIPGVIFPIILIYSPSPGITYIQPIVQISPSIFTLGKAIETQGEFRHCKGSRNYAYSIISCISKDSKTLAHMVVNFED